MEGGIIRGGGRLLRDRVTHTNTYDCDTSIASIFDVSTAGKCGFFSPRPVFLNVSLPPSPPPPFLMATVYAHAAGKKKRFPLFRRLPLLGDEGG